MAKIKTLRQKQEAVWLHIRKVDGGFIVNEEFEDEDKPDIPHVCQNIDQMLALVDSIFNKRG